MKKNLIIVFVLIFFVQLFAVFQKTTTGGFDDALHYSSFDLELRLLESIHNDVGQPLWLIRIFHNKVEGFVFDVFGDYLQFWKLSFLASFLSLAGIVGLVAQFYYFFAKTKKPFSEWIFFVILLCVPFIEIFFYRQLPLALRQMLIFLPYFIWSMLGYRQAIFGKKINIKIILGIIVLSILYQIGAFIS